MTYAIRQEYGEEKRTQLAMNFNAVDLERDQKWAEEDLFEVQKFIDAVKFQREIVAKTTFTTEISLSREKNYGTKLINYYVNAYLIPDISNGEKAKIHIFGEAKRFPKGTWECKIAAAKYAIMLSKLHGDCRIVGNAADLVGKVAL